MPVDRVVGVLAEIKAGLVAKSVHLAYAATACSENGFDLLTGPLVTRSSYPLIAIDPVAFSLGPLDVHWYGIMYLLAFGFFWAGGIWVARNRPWWGWTPEMVGDMLFYGMVGVVVGGRLGYVLFYGLDSFLQNPLFLFRITDGGMSFHGGLLGVIVAMWWFGRRKGRGFWPVADFVAPLVPVGLALGRIGNFIGGELWGRLSDAPWAMIFANAIRPQGWQSAELHAAWASGALDHLARHPSQLYQALGEGLTLFLILAVYARKPRPTGAVAGLFLIGYGGLRFVAEFFREPDLHLGFIGGDWLTMGMLLSLPMMLAGIIVLSWAYGRNRKS
jgi:phosphatidylglycerol:prolipoprotein diacylglycerol transferase